MFQKFQCGMVLLCLFPISLFAQSSQSLNQEELKSFRDQVDSLFNAHIQRDGPGAGLLISYKDQKLVSKGYGLRNLESGEPITPSTNFRMGSVSKQFTALAVLSLIEEGKISLQDTVGNILPAKVLSDVTVEQFIYHTSGIAHYEEHFFTEWDTTQIVENNDILTWYQGNPDAESRPGEKWSYSNGGYNLLATLVEKVSGQGFADYAKENVFERLGMENSQYFNLADPVQISERAFCYDLINGEWEKVDGHYLNGCLGEGAVYTSLNEYYKYDQALRNESAFSTEIHELIFTPAAIDVFLEKDYRFAFNRRNTVKYAKGWYIDQDIAYHTGSWYGQRAIVLRGLEEPFTIALFLNIGDSALRKELIEKTYYLVKKQLKLEQDL